VFVKPFTAVAGESFGDIGIPGIDRSTVLGSLAVRLGADDKRITSVVMVNVLGNAGLELTLIGNTASACGTVPAMWACFTVLYAHNIAKRTRTATVNVS
jgi:hypothetical protein